MATVKGAWKFNEILTLPSAAIDAVECAFTFPNATGDSSTGWYIQVSPSRVYTGYVRSSDGSTAYSHRLYEVDDGWQHPFAPQEAYAKYCIIDFGTTDQTVSDEFYAWLKENAIQLKIADLTNTAWYVPSGWQADAGSGQFAVTGLYNDENELGFIDIGYYATDAEENGIDLNGVPFRNTEDFTLNITGGTDATNPDLIAWLTTYGTQLKVTDLTGTNWYLYSWQIPETEIQYNNILGHTDIDPSLAFSQLHIGTLDHIEFNDAEGNLLYLLGDCSGTIITFTGGTDATNPDLIAWLSIYGIQLKVTDLTGTTWHIPAGWSVEGGYGHFSVTNINEGEAPILPESDAFFMGYTYIETPDGSYAPVDAMSDIITRGFGETLTTNNEYTLTFTGGTDVTNPRLISWLSQYGELSATVQDIIAKVFYGDTLLAELRAGQQATLHCTEKIMEHNVVVQKIKDSTDKVTVSTSTEMPTYEAEYDAGLTVVCDGKIMPEDVAVEVIS